MTPSPTVLTALLVAPNRQMADQFTRSMTRNRCFQILGDLKSYPQVQTLEIRLRQLRPDVLLIDVATDLDAACELIRAVVALRPSVPVIGLHTANDSQAIVKSLRTGATEFLYAPFEVSIQEAAISRIQKLIQPEYATTRETGKVIVFSSTKPGSGASTLAVQLAFALTRKNARVLLIDLDLLGGTVGMNLNLEYDYSVVDVLQHADRLDAKMWSSAVVTANVVDVLAAPDLPHAEPIEPARLHDLLQYARHSYEWVIVDAPAVFHRISLLAISEADKAFLISTPELASLHLARKGVKLLNQLGFENGRFQVLINRVEKRSEFNGGDIGKLLECKVDASLPNDFFSLQSVTVQGKPLAGDSDLGRAIEGLAGKLAGEVQPETKGSRSFLALRPLLTRT
jgi:pilus assembly protein CpaE